ncbi:hypothetical protein R3W88_008069 [Solanum pinnatisectum]|uniref:Uncharacterized protein n=1 Tax=Solanum pinnatisectum TaxID=50273 RepID=A0AAV9M6V1_9SOLN|nr:hypothetical protein R3W88_008069 [Solanum pinnatisectum]
MSSIAFDPCDYDMGDYDCDEEGYGCEDNETNGNESYYSGGEFEENGGHSSYGENEEEASCGSSYDDEGACERSYSHSESEDGFYDDAATCCTSQSQDECKAGMREVPRASVPKGLIFLSLKEGVIPRHILIGSGNVSRLSKSMI